MIKGETVKVNNLQAVRAAAALVVVCLHTGYSVGGLHPFGSFGVDLFFVLSGFIMAGVCGREPRSFFLRRLIRIGPPYWAMTVLLFGFVWACPTLVVNTRANSWHLLKSLLFVPYRKPDGGIYPLLFMGWTLNCEFLFYVILGLALAVSRRRALPLAAAVLLGVVAACQPLRGLGAVADFYSRPVLLEFLVGLLCYHIYRTAREPGPVGRAGLGALAAGSFLGMVAYEGAFGSPLDYDWARLGVDGLLSSVVIASAALLAKSGADLRPGFVVLVGDASYVLYLVHEYVVLVLGRVVARRFPLVDPAAHFAGVALAVLLSVSLAIVLHLWVERPVLRALTRRLVPGASPGGGLPVDSSTGTDPPLTRVATPAAAGGVGPFRSDIES